MGLGFMNPLTFPTIPLQSSISVPCFDLACRDVDVEANNGKNLRQQSPLPEREQPQLLRVYYLNLSYLLHWALPAHRAPSDERHKCRVS